MRDPSRAPSPAPRRSRAEARVAGPARRAGSRCGSRGRAPRSSAHPAPTSAARRSRQLGGTGAEPASKDIPVGTNPQRQRSVCRLVRASDSQLGLPCRVAISPYASDARPGVSKRRLKKPRVSPPDASNRAFRPFAVSRRCCQCRRGRLGIADDARFVQASHRWRRGAE